MKKYIISLIICLLISCGTTKKYSWETIKNSADFEVCRDTLNRTQLDSICISNNISNNLNDWSLMMHYNSKNDVLTQYLYTTDSEVYTITKSDTLFIFTKRTNKTK